MKELAPQDSPAIEELTGAVRTCARYDLPVDKAPELYGTIDGTRFLIRMFPFLQAHVEVEEGHDPGLRPTVLGPVPAGRISACSSTSRISRWRASDHDPGLDASQVRRLSGGRFARVLPQHRTALPRSGREDSLPLAGRGNPGGARQGRGRATGRRDGTPQRHHDLRRRRPRDHLRHAGRQVRQRQDPQLLRQRFPYSLR